MNDPTYNQSEIKANPTWHAAFIMSECLNNDAPIGWGKYIWIAEQMRVANLFIGGAKRPKSKQLNKPVRYNLRLVRKKDGTLKWKD